MKRIFLSVLMLIVTSSFGADRCSEIKDARKRLACYDNLEMRKTKPSECQDFEDASDALMDRFSVGFQSPGEYQGPLAALLSAYGKCRAKGPSQDTFQTYDVNMQAFMVINEVWSWGVEQCRFDCHPGDWKIFYFAGNRARDIRSKYTVLSQGQYKTIGDVNSAMFGAIKRFQ